MKNLILKFVGKKISTFFLIIICALNNSIVSQNNYPVPENFGNERVAEFYPIGWSESANFAYMVLSLYPFKGAYWTFVIQNTKTDKILYSFEFGDDDYGAKDISNPQKDWSYIYRKTRRYLEKYKIEPQREFYKFREISTRRGYDYKVSYRERTSFEQDDEYGNREKTIGFRLKVYNGSRSKTITNYKITRDPLNSGDSIADTAFFGAIESPFEDRIVVITSFKIYDYQGDYDGTALSVSGCKLNTGFK